MEKLKKDTIVYYNDPEHGYQSMIVAKDVNITDDDQVILLNTVNEKGETMSEREVYICEIIMKPSNLEIVLSMNNIILREYEYLKDLVANVNGAFYELAYKLNENFSLLEHDSKKCVIQGAVGEWTANLFEDSEKRFYKLSSNLIVYESALGEGINSVTVPSCFNNISLEDFHLMSTSGKILAIDQGFKVKKAVEAYLLEYNIQTQERVSEVDINKFIQSKWNINEKLIVNIAVFEKTFEHIEKFQKFYVSGEIAEEGWKNNNAEKVGLWKNYFKSGVVKTAERYHNDKLHGECSTFWDNGVLWELSRYKEGNRVGNIYIYNRTGDLYKVLEEGEKRLPLLDEIKDILTLSETRKNDVSIYNIKDGEEGDVFIKELELASISQDSYEGVTARQVAFVKDQLYALNVKTSTLYSVGKEKIKMGWEYIDPQVNQAIAGNSQNLILKYEAGKYIDYKCWSDEKNLWKTVQRSSSMANTEDVKEEWHFQRRTYSFEHLQGGITYHCLYRDDKKTSEGVSIGEENYSILDKGDTWWLLVNDKDEMITVPAFKEPQNYKMEDLVVSKEETRKGNSKKKGLKI